VYRRFIVKFLKEEVLFRGIKESVRVGTHGRLRYDHSELTGRAYGP
jgi:hypothetical protein